MSMRILFISGHFPDDLATNVHGVYQRMGMFVDAIKEVATVDMLFFVGPENYRPEAVKDIEQAFSNHWNTDINLTLCSRSEFKDSTEITKWLSFVAGISSFYKQKGRIEFSGREQIQALENCLDRNPDAVFAHRLSAMCPLLLTKRPLPPVFFDMDDIEHVVLERYIENRENIRSNFLKLLIPSLRSGEYNAVKLASKTFVCSESDRKYLSEKFKLPGITVIPNAVTIPAKLVGTIEQTLLFLGSDYGPNLEAAEFLICSIWPHIYSSIPKARLIIAGVSENKLSSNIQGTQGLEFTGFVKDLDSLYNKTRAVAVPILQGSGTRFKIIEAAAYGKPVVSTKLGAEGIDIIDGEEIFLRDNPKDFAEVCIDLLSNSNLCTKMGAAAREKTLKHYNRDNIVKLIRQHIESIISKTS